MTETLKKSASSTLSVLIPVYNERATIQTLISRVKTANIGQTGKEIIVIDDGSVDGTFELVETIADIRLLRHEKNQGKGAAVRSGIAAATGDIIIIVSYCSLNKIEFPDFKPSIVLVDKNNNIKKMSPNIDHSLN